MVSTTSIFLDLLHFFYFIGNFIDVQLLNLEIEGISRDLSNNHTYYYSRFDTRRFKQSTQILNCCGGINFGQVDQRERKKR
jgi:hypothetical protein